MRELTPSSTSENIAIVLNPSAGQASDVSAAIRSKRPDARILVPRKASDVQAMAAQALQDGARIIVAAGGDGTIRTVAQEVAGSDATLAVLPLGTRNHFAQDIGVPLDLDGAFRLLLTGTVRRIDVGAVNGRIFLLYAALGLYPNFVRERERHEARDKRHGLLPFARALWTTLRRYPMLRVSVTTGDRTAEHDSPFVFVANNIAMREHLPVGTITRAEMGELAVYTAHRIGRVQLLQLLLRLWFGQVGEPSDLSFGSAERVRIETKRKKVWVATDGEVVRLEPPLEVELRRNALQVLTGSG